MLIADTSIWVDHFRKPEAKLIDALIAGRVQMHELVIAELALGSVPDRDLLLADLKLLPQLVATNSSDLITFVSKRELYASGIGYVDAQLLWATHNSQTRLWTRDKRLAAQAEKLGLLYLP